MITHESYEEEKYLVVYVYRDGSWWEGENYLLYQNGKNRKEALKLAYRVARQKSKERNNDAVKVMEKLVRVMRVRENTLIKDFKKEKP